MADHIPVMLNEVLAHLAPANDEVYVDGTFGAGGYTQGILDRADCTVVAIDRDPSAAARAQGLKAKYGDRLVFIHGCFGDVEELLKNAGFEKVDGFVLDLGVSSMQIDQASRGFSFRFDGPLDMRMDTSRGETAADLVNGAPEKKLADLIYKYGEERHSRRVASAIAARRREKKFETTGDLAAVVRSVVPRSKDEIDPATRTFQALRIVVNDELGELERALGAAENILNPGGRFIVVSFHSLEDARVKDVLRRKSGNAPGVSRHSLIQEKQDSPVFNLVSKKAVQPSDGESRVNPRARSARLRAAVRAGAA
ncbi:MAG: 16S rRNA (cytosine(1402)-N(4))-methyltransferase RsmH [Alphaproteobacteria bacterium]